MVPKLFQINIIDQWDHAVQCITSSDEKFLAMKIECSNESHVKEELYCVCTFSVTLLLLLLLFKVNSRKSKN
jgi:hypothetical protein